MKFHTELSGTGRLLKFIHIVLHKSNFLSLFLAILLLSCSSMENKDPVTGKKVRKEPNAYEKQKKFVKKEGSIIFGGGSDPSGNTSQAFGVNNIMWKATLKTFETIPIQVSDFSGGVLITDWYGDLIDGNGEQIKITVNFLSNELSASSIQVSSHKKICKNNNCSNTLLNKDFSDKIKARIFDNVKKLKIAKDSKNQ